MKGREGRLVTNPYCGECGHAYCYTCLTEAVVEEDGDGWGCLRCGTIGKKVRRWEEIVGEAPQIVQVTEGKPDAVEDNVVEQDDTSSEEEIQEDQEEEEEEDGIRIL